MKLELDTTQPLAFKTVVDEGFLYIVLIIGHKYSTHRDMGYTVFCSYFLLTATLRKKR